MKKKFSLNQEGFTLIELLMVILVVAILAVVGITQFTNFGSDARESALKANLQVLRNGIAAQNGMMHTRCGNLSGAWPPLANIIANDITSGATPCTTTQVPVLSDRAFVTNGIPVNPWTNALATAAGLAASIDQCDAACIAALPAHALPCVAAKTRDLATATGWCYDVNTGTIWANSAGNDGLGGVTGNEYTY